MGDVLKSKTVAIGTDSTALLSAVANGVTIITDMQIGNVDAGNASASASLTLNKNGAGAVTFQTGLGCLAAEMTTVFGGNKGKLYLVDDGTPDALAATASAADDLVAVISYIERT